MWIKSEKGDLINAAHLTKIELEKVDKQWVLGAYAADRLPFTVLARYDNESEARRLFDTLAERLGTLELKPTKESLGPGGMVRR